MGATNGLALPIPELTDTADGPDAISDLANATEDYFFDRILPAGVARYVPYHWGASASLPTAAQGAKVGDTVTHTGLACVMRAIDPTATIPVWRQITLSEVTNLAARDAISTNYASLVHAGFKVRQTDVGVTWEWTGTAWAAITSVRGKMWRTGAFSGSMANATEYAVPMGAAKVSGGFVWGGGDNTAGALSYLTIPFDGRYDLVWQIYLTGGATAVVNVWPRRTRASIADYGLGGGNVYKPNTGIDQQSQLIAPDLALKAGDQLRLVAYQYSGPVAFYGVNEVSGCFLSATYVGPLNGAIPL